MIRPLFTAGLLAATASAQLLGDFDCTSDLDGPYVNFDDAFADHISPGAIMVEASYFADAYTCEAAILTAKGQVVLVSCPYIP